MPGLKTCPLCSFKNYSSPSAPHLLTPHLLIDSTSAEIGSLTLSCKVICHVIYCTAWIRKTELRGTYIWRWRRCGSCSNGFWRDSDFADTRDAPVRCPEPWPF